MTDTCTSHLPIQILYTYTRLFIIFPLQRKNNKDPVSVRKIWTFRRLFTSRTPTSGDSWWVSWKWKTLFSEELGMRSEEWWMGHTIHIVPQYPFLYKIYTLRRFQILCAATIIPHSSFLIPNYISPSIYKNGNLTKKTNIFIIRIWLFWFL